PRYRRGNPSRGGGGGEPTAGGGGGGRGWRGDRKGALGGGGGGGGGGSGVEKIIFIFFCQGRGWDRGRVRGYWCRRRAAPAFAKTASVNASSGVRHNTSSAPPDALRMFATYGLRTATTSSPPRARSSRRRATSSGTPA